MEIIAPLLFHVACRRKSIPSSQATVLTHMRKGSQAPLDPPQMVGAPGVTLVEQEGPYGAEGFTRQALVLLPNFSGQYPVLGSWLIDHTACRLSIREDKNPITGNTSRFLPHAIL